MEASSGNVSRKASALKFRGGDLKPTGGDLRIATWNVEGLTDAKLVQLRGIMEDRGIDILCMQETHVGKSEYIVDESGYLLIHSGREDEEREYAGVGFLVAPRLRRSIVGFCQLSSRIAYIKIRVRGGKAVVFNAYAPHGGRGHDERQQFYSQLADVYRSTSSHGIKLIAGDLNARLHKRLAGEEERVGEFVFGNPRQVLKEGSNRELLIEMCVALDLVIANTLQAADPQQQVTYYELGASPHSELTPNSFAVLDYILVPRGMESILGPVLSDRTAALASHHFLVSCLAKAAVKKDRRQGRKQVRRSRAALGDEDVAEAFAKAFDESMRHQAKAADINAACDQIGRAFEHASGKALPEEAATPQRPWIREGTQDLLKQRARARAEQDAERERDLDRRIKASVRHDRRAWLEERLGQKDWDQIRKLRKGTCVAQGRLRNMDGQLVDSDRRAETMAQYLEQVQWAVRQTRAAPERPHLGEDLPVDMGPFTAQELRRAAKNLKSGRAAGCDGIPGEFWKAVAGGRHMMCVPEQLGSSGNTEPVLTEKPVADWILDFCNRVWEAKAIPDAWRQARVATLYKKGSPADCGNYRPISLLAVGYKMFASMLLRRLQKAGAEQRLWPTQFGFRTGMGTTDALFLARRSLEEAWATKDGKAVLLALDWAKAFDSVTPEALFTALRRFGVPEGFVRMVQGIYAEREFVVKDAGVTSDPHPQKAGICQGCPLSPFLFVILMTVLIHDAVREMADGGATHCPDQVVGEILYADDTLLVDLHGGRAEEYMNCIGRLGEEYGLGFNVSKLEMLCANCDVSVRAPGGGEGKVKRKDNMVYLGATLAADGRVDSEVARRLGMAHADFKTLQRLWGHANLPVKDKVRIFDACVVSRLTYGLQTAWLPTAMKRRLDGFQARCLRRVCRIPAAYISRVSNQEVLARTGSSRISTRIQEQQFILAGRYMAAPTGTPTKEALLKGMGPAAGCRPRGRPRKTWVTEVMPEALWLAGDAANLEKIGGTTAWKDKVKQHCRETEHGV